jgi:hypothetical protein
MTRVGAECRSSARVLPLLAPQAMLLRLIARDSKRREGWYRELCGSRKRASMPTPATIVSLVSNCRRQPLRRIPWCRWRSFRTGNSDRTWHDLQRLRNLLTSPGRSAKSLYQRSWDGSLCAKQVREPAALQHVAVALEVLRAQLQTPAPRYGLTHVCSGSPLTAWPMHLPWARPNSMAGR